MFRQRLIASLLAVFMIVSLVGQGTLVLAGTTGTLTGTVDDAQTGKPLAGVKVTATSPSQTATGVTDGSGHFNFLSLAPDTYTVSAELTGFEAGSTPGVTIAADTTRVLPLTISKTLRQIGRVSSRSATSLVRPGTTADIYSINAAQQAAVAGAGGGGNLDSAFSALSTVPGVFVSPGQSGYVGAAATLSIRGGDYDQIGYQIDGLPVNRAFDNYPSGATSSLGQQELQAYTGAPPTGSSSQGLSGFINQVIKTGTNPGFVTVDAGIGTPYYHKVNVEVGGVTANNRISYYFGAGGYNQTQRYIDQYDGASISNLYGPPLGPACSAAFTQAQTPSCYVNGKLANPSGGGYILGPANSFLQSQVADRDVIGNVHFYFPHKDGSRDDLQLLYDSGSISTQDYTSTNDLGGVPLSQLINGTLGNNNSTTGLLANGNPNISTYIDGYQLNLPTGGFLPTNYRQYASQYFFPNSSTHSFDDAINPGIRDGFNNDQEIAKLQFTKSLGTRAFFRAYGFNNYSDWLNSGPSSAYDNYVLGNGLGVSYDYELESHTRGAGFTFSDQIGSANLLTVEGDYTHSTVIRDNNSEFLNGLSGPNTVSSRTAIGVAVDSNNPTNGICYSAAGVAVNCYNAGNGYNTAAQFATLQQAYNGTVTPLTGTCGTGPCKYLVIGNGEYATYNAVKPTFYGASINDEIRPTSKLTVNLGMRLDDYQYQGSDTSGGPARAFWYAAYNREECESTTTQLLSSKAALKIPVGSSCTSVPGGGYENVDFTNPSGNVTQTYPEFQPRAGLTYSLSPRTVIRASYGRFTQPPNSAFEQYDALQSNAPALLYGSYGFQQYGYTTPNHPIPPAASNNFDFSLEQALPNQISFKISPFLRQTQNQIQQFFLNRATNFVSGLNVGNQRSQGVEFELDKGDFARDGLSAKLAFAYTNSYIKYNTLSNGSTVLTPVVNAVKAYNALTKAGGGSPCYTPLDAATGTGGTPVAACVKGDVANPYYNAPLQDPNAFSGANNYVPYDTIPAAIGVSSTQYGAPYVATLALSEKTKHFTIAPIVQYQAGIRYGSPLATQGIDPTSCSGVLATRSTTGDPRYQYGASGGSPYDAATCGQLSGGIPNPQSGGFDGLGAYADPSQLLLHLQMKYDFSKTFGLTANFTNLVNTCFGGSNVPWKVAGACSYGLVNDGLNGGIGNAYNPGDTLQSASRYSYEPAWSQQPLGIYVDANLKL